MTLDLYNLEKDIQQQLVKKLQTNETILTYTSYGEPRNYYYFLIGKKILHYIVDSDDEIIVQLKDKNIIQEFDIDKANIVLLSNFLNKKEIKTIDEVITCLMNYGKDCLESKELSDCIQLFETTYHQHLLELKIPTSIEHKTFKI